MAEGRSLVEFLIVFIFKQQDEPRVSGNRDGLCGGLCGDEKKAQEEEQNEVEEEIKNTQHLFF